MVNSIACARPLETHSASPKAIWASQRRLGWVKLPMSAAAEAAVLQPRSLSQTNTQQQQKGPKQVAGLSGQQGTKVTQGAHDKVLQPDTVNKLYQCRGNRCGCYGRFCL